MVRTCPHSGIHCLNCDLWDSGVAMISCSHRPDRDSTPCFSLEQASMSKSQHGLVLVPYGVGNYRGTPTPCMLRMMAGQTVPLLVKRP